MGGHLFAEAVRQSFQYGFSGFVFMKVKSSLNRHYKKTLGAQDLNKSERTMYIGHKAAKELYEKYYGNNE